MTPLHSKPGTDSKRLIVAGATLFGLLLCAMVGYSLWREHRIKLEEAESRTANRSRVIEQYTRETLRRVEQGLAHAVAEAARAGGAARLDSTEMRNSLQALGSSDELFQRLIVVNRDGGTILATAARAGSPANWSQNADFLAQRARQGSRIIIGAPAGGDAAGKRYVPVSIRITERDGSFAGIVVVEIDPAYLSGVLQSTSNEPASFATVFLRSGWIIARNPPDAAMMSRTWLDTPMFRQHLPATPVGTVRQVVVATGVESLYSYRALIDYPVVVAAGVSLTAALAPWRERMVRDLALLGVALAILAGAAMLLLRNLHRRDSSEARILRLNMLYAAQSKINAAVVRAPDFPSLCKEVCEIAVDVGGMSCALVRLLDVERQLLLPVAFHGPNTGLIGRHELPATGSTGISANAFGNCEATVVNDIATSPVTQHVLFDQSIGSVRSAAAFPLIDGEERAFGTFAVFGPGIGFFDAEMTALLGETTASLAFAYGKLAGDLALKVSERNLMLAQQGGRIGSFIIDIGAATWTTSEVGSEILGVDAGRPRPLADFAAMIAPEGRDDALASMRANIASGERSDYTYQVLRGSDGARRWVRVIASTEAGSDGNALRRLGTVQDVTEQVVAEERVRQLGRFKAALSKTNAAIARAIAFGPLCDEVCRIAVAEGGLVAATVMRHDPGLATLEVIAGHGRREGRISRNSARVDDPVGASPAAFRENRRVIIADLVGGAHAGEVADEAAAQGITAIGAFPLSASGACFGTFAVFAHDAGVLDGETADALGEIADALAFAHAKLLAQGDLRERERDLDLAQRAGRVGLLVTDVTNGTWMTNAIGGEIAGLDGLPRFRPLDDFVTLLAPETREQLADAMRRNVGSLASISQQYEIVRPDNGQRRWIRIDSAIDTSGGQASRRRIGTLHDVTGQVLAERRILRLSRLYAALSNTNAAVLRAADFSELAAQACRIVIEDGGLAAATVRVYEERSESLVRVAQFGAITTLIARPVIDVDDARGVASRAFKSREPVIVHDMAADPLTLHAAADAMSAGIRGAAGLPLMADGRAIGTFTVFAADSAILDQQTVGLLSEIAGAVAFAHAKLSADAALKASERNMMRAQKAGRIGSIVFDHAALTWTTSEVGCEILGLDGVRPRAISEAAPLSPPASRMLARATMWSNIDAGLPTTTEYRIVRPSDGAERWVRLVAESEFGDDGKPLRRLGTLQDITEQKVSEQRIRRLSMLYEALSRTNEAVMRESDFGDLSRRVCAIAVETGGMVASLIRLVDPASSSLVSFARAGPVPELLASATVAVDSPYGMAAEAYRTRQPFIVQDMARHPATARNAPATLAAGIRAGGAFPITSGGEVIGTLIVFAADAGALDNQTADLVAEIAEAIGFAHEKFRSESARRDSDARIAAVVGSAMDAIITCDDSFRIVVFNDAAAQMFGCATADAIGASIDRFIPERFRGGHGGFMRGFGTSGITSRSMGAPGQIMALRADRSEFPAEASISHTVINGRVIYTVIMRDVAQRMAAERRIERLTNLYAALSKTNEAIVRGDDWTPLCATVCRIIVEHGGVQSAVIRMPDAAHLRLEPVAGHGPRAAGMGQAAIEFSDHEHPTVRVYRDGVPHVIGDFLAYVPRAESHDTARELGVQSAVAVALRIGEVSIGTLSVFARDVGHFDPELTQLLVELAGNLAFAHRKLEADRATRESEERFRALTMMASDWYWETDEHHRFTRMSGGTQGSPNEVFDTGRVIGRARWDFGPEVMDKAAASVHRDALERHQPFRDFEYRRIGPEGTVTFRQISGEPVFDEAGRFTGYRGVGRNVSAQRQAERALVESELHYRTLFDASPDAIRVTRGERIVMLNAAGRRLFGIDASADLSTLGAFDFIPPEERERSARRLHEVLELGRPVPPMETVYQRRDGSTIKAEVVTIPFNYDGAPAALSIMRDLTERYHQQRVLEEAERRYRSLVESSLGGVIILNGENIEYANPAFVQMLGYASAEDAIGRSILSLATPDFHQQLRANIRQLASRPHQSLPAAQMRMRRTDGAVIDVRAAASSIELEGRTLIQSEMRDITRERRALAEIRALNENLEARIEERTRELRDANFGLETANRELESFSYSVAHDLRAPLRTMNGFAQLLEMDVAAGSYDEIPRHASRISHNAERMNALIDGLLAVARVTHGALGDDRVDFAAMVAETVREAPPGPQVRLDIGALPVVRGDTATLRQVWRNLISNAIKYSARRDRPEIGIACDLRDSEIVFHVQDNGAGFDPVYAQRLFGVFQRLHTAQEFEGNGVGLAVVRRIVERHGGRAWAEGRPDAGATFYFSLPASRIITPAA